MPSKQKSVVAIFLLFAVIWFYAGCRSQAGDSSAQTRQSQRSGPKTMAPDFTLQDINGKSVSLKDFRGKVVFIDFWATWCPPCVASSPKVEELSHDYAAKGVEVLSISLDDSAESVRAFAERKKLKNRMLMAGSSGVDVHYQINGIPSFFLIDQQGHVVAGWSGFSPAMANMWREEIDSLLKS